MVTSFISAIAVSWASMFHVHLVVAAPSRRHLDASKSEDGGNADNGAKGAKGWQMWWPWAAGGHCVLFSGGAWLVVLAVTQVRLHT